ncbi:Carcinine transporter [Eumeta japonica]|uniref:Carcinine transporter n=1 Tax=Eumeta variegata TaxID=151549 RepID=A0A4C1WYV1_EUMVA|nr:Carcinine transporter [Eumeta japonica]
MNQVAQCSSKQVFDATNKDRLRTGESQNGNIGETKKKIKDFDDILPLVGQFGWYQRILFLLMIPYATFFAFVYFTQIFMSVVPEEHWCWVPELADMTAEERRNLAIPLDGDMKHDKCLMYDIDFKNINVTSMTGSNSNWPVTKCKHGWEYNFTDVPYQTISTELDWVCERDAYPATAQSVFFCGAILGGFIFGFIADKYGRIPALVGTNMIGFFAGVGTAFCNSFWSFCLCRFLVGMAYDNCFTVMYIIVIEYVGPKWRTFVANMSIAIFFTFSACSIPWIAIAVSDWKIYTLVTSVPLVLSILTPWVVPESARWLISQGKIDKAIKIIKRCEKINGTTIPEEALKEFKESALRSYDDNSTRSYSVLDLFKTPRLRRHFVLLVLIWMCIAVVFDGHVRNVDNLGLNVFLTFTVATFTECPADIFLILILDRLGRRWVSFSSMAVSGIFSILATTVQMGLPSATLAILGRFAVNISYNIGLQYAAELLPTVVRGQGVALIHIMGCVASIVAPFIVYLATIAVEIPLLILGCLGVFGGVLCLFLPESMGKDMPETLEEGEGYGVGQKFWDNPCCGRGYKHQAEANAEA